MGSHLGVTHRAPLRWLVLGAAALLAVPAVSFGQVDNFNDGNDNGWTRYDPLAQFGAPATYSFPGGNTYRIQTQPSPNPAQLGPSRAGSVRAGVTYTGFYTSVDLVDWNTGLDQAWGILGRVSNVGLGQTDGYAFTYANDGPSIDISRVDNEQPTGLGDASVTLDPAQDYRLVFIGTANGTLRGQVFDLANPTVALATVTATDTTYASGNNGLVTFDNSSGGVGATDATFDNYVATRPGDATLDGVVNLADFGRLRANFGDPTAAGDFTRGDFNIDGVVNLADFGLLRGNFNQNVGNAPSAADWAAMEAELVPEPGAGALVGLLGGAGLLARRRR